MKRRYDLLYAIGALVSSPFLAFGLLRTGKWRTDWKGRFGKTPVLPSDPRPTLLLHGVSVGEINATRALVARLKEAGTPQVRVVISATTNTGYDRARELYGHELPVVRFPFDFSWMVGRFLDRLEPQAVALMELEVWPNLAQECQGRGIPMAVINGRLSDSSFGTYRWARRWVRPMFQGLAAVAAQTEEYAQRFRDLGTPVDRVTVTDNMKWDTVTLVDEVEGAADLRSAMGIDPGRPLVVAGSTGPGEEELLIRDRPDGVQLMLVPRKPERFAEVARLAPGMVRRTQRPDGWSTEGGVSGSGATVQDGPPTENPAGRDLFLLDTMGELTKAYALADVAVVGRSFVPLGGSDPIEAVALGKPTLIGPRHENFRDVVNALQEGGGIRVTQGPMETVKELLAAADKARAMAHAGREVIRKRQGATERHARLLLDLVVGGGFPAAGNGRPRKRVRRFLLTAFALYMAAGYLTSAFSRVEVSAGVSPATPLPTPERTLLSGVFSVHTERSHDAWGTREQVGAAASDADLDFVIIGDHPPDNRRPNWELWDPLYLDDVFIGGGVELRAPGVGKVLAMEVDSTYRRWESDLGSFFRFLGEQDAPSMVVHARGPRASERWDHEEIGGIQGFEVVDISEFSRARLRGPWSLYHLILSAAGFPFGLADEALLHTMREGFETPTVAAYDSLRAGGALTATAGLNIHPKLRLGPLLVPSYGPFFRTLVSHLAVEGALARDPRVAQRAIGEGIERGELFISLGDHQFAGGFRLAAMGSDGGLAHMGADVRSEPGIVLRGGFEESPHRKLAYRVLRDGREVEWVLGPELEWDVPASGVYRVEVYAYSVRLGSLFFRLRPWVFANPIGLLEEVRGAGHPDATEGG